MLPKYYWKVDECALYFDRMRLRGWCSVPGARVASIEIAFDDSRTSFTLKVIDRPSPDVAAVVDSAAHSCRFDEWIPVLEAHRGRDFGLRITLQCGRSFTTGSVYENCRIGDPGHACWYRFLDLLQGFETGDVLEIGARARSGVVRKSLINPRLRYVGLDIMAGENVDVVGDAHCLEEQFGSDRFVAVYSLAVFEHLAMPWKVALEINRVLQIGGLVFVNSVQTWPVHEEPCDYWRFTKYAWSCLFNSYSGFELVEVAHGEPARVHPCWDSHVVSDMPTSLAYLSSNVIARKLSDSTLTWPVPTKIVAPSEYPV